jgi:cyclase
MRMIDLSSPVDASFWEPDPVVHTAMSPADGARHMASEMLEHFGMEFDVNVLPQAEFLNNDTLTLTTHTGTHVDAPAHYGSTATYRAEGPRTVDELPLEWFHNPAFVLDISDAGTGVVDAARIEKELDRIGYSPEPMDIALLYTGAADRVGTPAYFTDFVGLDRSATEFLLDRGVRVIGTDAFSLDAPFTYIMNTFKRTGDREVLWPAHFVGREREYCQIERLANLETLPRPFGFTVTCFPVKIMNAGAGWARAVAMIDD